MNIVDIAKQFLECNILKFGDFTLRSGKKSQFYIDLRLLPSYPQLFNTLVNELAKKLLNFGRVRLLGVAYNGITLATALSLATNIPLIYNRKEKKEYGTKKQLEGYYEEGDNIIIVDDVLTSGTSIAEVITLLNENKLNHIANVVLIDRRLKPDELLFGKLTISLITLIDLFRVMKCNNLINENPYKSIETRGEMLMNEKAKRLYDIVNRKSTNIIVSADDMELCEINELVNKISGDICAIKLHLDTIKWNEYEFNKLVELSKMKNFMIIEDRKFADIGKTVSSQVKQLPIGIDIVTAHSVFGDTTILGIRNARPDLAVLLLAQASPTGNIIDENYTAKTVEIAKRHRDNVIGFISQNEISTPEFLYIAPGINISAKTDNLLQSYKTPQMAKQAGIDIIIVGRGITTSSDPIKTVKEYKY